MIEESDIKKFCLITSVLPSKLDVCGKLFEIDTRTAVAVDCLIALQDAVMHENIKAAYVCNRIIASKSKDFPGQMIKDGFEACQKFLSGPPEQAISNQKSTALQKPIMDYLQDAEAVVAAFWQAYGLDLEQTANLHWWTFLALLKHLPSETQFSKIVGIRTRTLSPKASVEEKAELRKAQSKVAVKDRRTAEQKRRAAQESINALDL